MSYSVTKNTKGRYDILEKDSGVTISLDCVNEGETRGFCRKLNLGSGFNGWTPEFLAAKFHSQVE